MCSIEFKLILIKGVYVIFVKIELKLFKKKLEV